MAGHSKWANIKYRKERADAKKGKAFSRVVKEIISAVKVGGSDPKTNIRLRAAIQKAKSLNMPNENVERNIKKAASNDQADFETVIYEIYGYGGVGIIVVAVTDNKNRTASDIRIAINKRGGTLSEPGSVIYNFKQQGVMRISQENRDKEDLFLLAIEAGAEDLEEDDDKLLVITNPSDLFKIKESLENFGIICFEEEIIYSPIHEIECSKEDQEFNIKLIEWLEDISDVEEVYSNMKQ